MQNAGGDLVKHYRDLAFMGFIEVAKNLSIILRNLRFCKQDIISFQPDVLILIDYPGFNLRIAKWAKQHGIKVIYYISPQVWAWKESRVKLIKDCVDKMLVILPFEKEFYKKWNFEVEYVGHPLIEVIENYKQQAMGNSQFAIGNRQLTIGNRENQDIIALLPGSRKQEILKKLPVMLGVSNYFPNHQFIIAEAPSLDHSFYETFTSEYSNVSSIANKTYQLLLNAKAALVTSGTATLETALFEVPEVVCYKASPVSYYIARQLIKVKYISLVNLIMKKEVVKELIQDELNVENLKSELSQILTNETRIAEIKKDYSELKKILSEGSNASSKAAASILQFLKKST
jgi:lipid-A-disaccharide synthase